MDQNAYLEVNVSQKPAIALLQSMGYTYISPEDCEKQRGSRYHVLLKDILRGQLRRLNRYSYAGAENEFSAANIERAMEELDILGNMKEALEFLLTGENDPEGQTLKAQVVEDICVQVVGELRRQRLTCGSWDYLEPHAHDLMEHIENPQIRALHVMEE